MISIHVGQHPHLCSQYLAVAHICSRLIGQTAQNEISGVINQAPVLSSRHHLPQMSLEEFKRQVQNQFAVVLSWEEIRALQKLYGEPGKGSRYSNVGLGPGNACCDSCGRYLRHPGGTCFKEHLQLVGKCTMLNDVVRISIAALCFFFWRTVQRGPISFTVRNLPGDVYQWVLEELAPIMDCTDCRFLSSSWVQTRESSIS